MADGAKGVLGGLVQRDAAGTPRVLGFSQGEMAMLAAAAIGRSKIGGVRPGYLLGPMGEIMMRHEGMQQPIAEREQFVKGMRGAGDTAEDAKLLGAGPLGVETYIKRKTQKPSTYGTAFTPERIQQIREEKEFEAGLKPPEKTPQYKDPEWQEWHENEVARRRKEHQEDLSAAESRREAILASRGGGAKAPPIYEDAEGPPYLFDPRSRQFLKQDERGEWAQTVPPKGLRKAGGAAGKDPRAADLNVLKTRYNLIRNKLKDIDLQLGPIPDEKDSKTQGLITARDRLTAESDKLDEQIGELLTPQARPGNGKKPAGAGKAEIDDPIIGETAGHGPIRESEVQHAMEKYKLSREEVFQKLGLAPEEAPQTPGGLPSTTLPSAPMTGTIGR